MEIAPTEFVANLPPGASIIDDLLMPGEEQALAAHLDGGIWSAELKRRVQHFGYRYDYKARAVTEEAYLGALPAWLEPLAARICMSGVFRAMPDQVIANEYLPGQGISAHVDCVPCFEDTIVSVSLLSACEMVFRERATGARCAINLHPRSAIVLKGAARYDWTHEIPARKSDVIDGVKTNRARRISLTFRRVIQPG